MENTLKIANIAAMAAVTAMAWAGSAAEPVQVRPAGAVRQYEQFASPVPGVSSPMLYADFWIALEPEPDRVLMTPAEIARYNDWNVRNTKALANWDVFPDELGREELTAYIDAISGSGGSSLQYPTEGFRYDGGRELTADDYARYAKNLNLGGVAERNPVRFGLVVRRELVRRFPTFDEVRNRRLSDNVNMFVESGAFPGEAAAVLHTSADGLWYLIRKHDYLAWIPADAVAIGDRKTVLGYLSPKEFLVVTAPQLRLEHNPEDARISERVYDMGCVLPLAEQVPDRVGGRVPYGCFVITVPVREADGSLKLVPALLPRSAPVNWGFLPYTRANFLRQAFALIGERYGWGEMYNGRDCSGIVRCVYSVFGFRMARNGTEQNLQMRGRFWDFAADRSPERVKQMLGELQAGDIMRFPGHTTMFLGRYNGKNYILHDTSGCEFFTPDGIISVPFWGVGVTPLDDMAGSAPDGTYLGNLQNVKRLGLSPLPATKP